MNSKLKPIPIFSYLRFLFGIFLLLIVVVIWVFSSVLIQTIFQELEYDQPLFLTYVNTAMFFIYIPILILLYLFRWVKNLIMWIGKQSEVKQNISNKKFQNMDNNHLRGKNHFDQIGNILNNNLDNNLDSNLDGNLDGHLVNNFEDNLDTMELKKEEINTFTQFNSHTLDHLSSIPGITIKERIRDNRDHNDFKAADSISNDSNDSASLEDYHVGSVSRNKLNWMNNLDRVILNLLPFKSKNGTIASWKKYMYIFVAACFLCPFWLWTNFAFNYSLKLTNITSNTILSSTSSTFCFLSGMMLGIDKFSFTRILSIAFVFAGILIIALEDQSEGVNTLKGDILAFASAVSYGCYTSLLSFLMNPPEKQTNIDLNLDNTNTKENNIETKYTQSNHSNPFETEQEDTISNSTEEKIQKDKYILSQMGEGTKMMTLFGFIGCINAITSWPFLIIAHRIGLEPFRFIPNWTVAGALILNGLIGTVLSDMLWAWSVLLASPLIGTLGLSLTIPLASATDIIMGKKSFKWTFALGALLVMIGFLGANLSYFFPKQLKKFDSPKFLRFKFTIYDLYWKFFRI